MQALEGALQGIMNAVSDAMALHPVLQWLGSFIGLGSFEGYPFRRVDREYTNNTQYDFGDLIFSGVNVYEVTVAGTSPSQGDPFTIQVQKWFWR